MNIYIYRSFQIHKTLTSDINLLLYGFEIKHLIELFSLPILPPSTSKRTVDPIPLFRNCGSNVISTMTSFAVEFSKNNRPTFLFLKNDCFCL